MIVDKKMSEKTMPFDRRFGVGGLEKTVSLIDPSLSHTKTGKANIDFVFLIVNRPNIT